MDILGFYGTAPITFINERHYETIKIIGLLGEVEASQRAYASQFNRDYTFPPIPAFSVHSFEMKSTDDIFYAFSEVQVNSSEPGHEQGSLELPEPRTPVRITQKGRQSRTTKEPISATSSMHPPQKSSSASRTEPPHQVHLESGDKVWQGVVVSSSTVQESSRLAGVTVPANRIVIRIKRPDIHISQGMVLNITGFVMFGNSTPPFASARKAIHNAMWGNPGLGIERFNNSRSLLLGYDNRTISLHPQIGKTAVFSIHCGTLYSAKDGTTDSGWV